MTQISPEVAAALINDNPDIRQLIVEKLAEQRETIDEHLKALGSDSVEPEQARRPGRPAKTKAPSTKITDGKKHTEAVLDALKTLKSGATSRELRDLLAEEGHPMESGTFHSTLQNLEKRGLIGKKPESRGSRTQKYSLAKNGKAARGPRLAVRAPI